MGTPLGFAAKISHLFKIFPLTFGFSSITRLKINRFTPNLFQMIEHVERVILAKHFVALKSVCQRLLSTLDPKFWPMFEKWGIGEPTLLQSSWFWSYSKEHKIWLRERSASLRVQKAHPLKRPLKGVISEKTWLYPRKRWKSENFKCS